MRKCNIVLTGWKIKIVTSLLLQKSYETSSQSNKIIKLFSNITLLHHRLYKDITSSIKNPLGSHINQVI